MVSLLIFSVRKPIKVSLRVVCYTRFTVFSATRIGIFVHNILIFMLLYEHYLSVILNLGVKIGIIIEN